MLDFKIIKQKDIIILDDGFSKIKFKNLNYELVNAKKINFFCLLKTFLKYCLKKNSLNFKEAYKQNLYRMYSPKLAISHHINKRSVECKYLCPEIKNAIYQFGYFNNKNKYNLKNFLGKFKNKNLIDKLFVFHEKDKKYLKYDKSKISVVGSVKNNEIVFKDLKKDKDTLLFISEYNPESKQKKSYYEKEYKLLKFINDFCISNNKKLNIALRSNRADKKINRNKEIQFYNKFFGNNYSISPMDSYHFAAKSEVIICISSNLGIELLARKSKVLFVLISESKNDYYPYLPKDELFVQRSLNKDKIFMKLKKMYDLKKKLWDNLLNIKINNLKFDPGNRLLKNEIEKIIKK